LTDNGSLRPVVDRAVPLADIAAAHRALEDGGVRGKIVVTV
jgi:NADPH:quinone reductase-like Zn-dependent oxidoreductase